VGIDVEPVDRSMRTLEIARRFFSVEETKALLQCADDERPGRFCELWTLKESMAKASGAGLGQSLRYPSFRMSPGGLRVSGAPGWSFLLADIGGTHKLAVATSQRSDVRLSAADPFRLTQGVLMTPVSDAT
jgi:4'-phosphopantetheinyl transferase